MTDRDAALTRATQQTALAVLHSATETKRRAEPAWRAAIMDALTAGVPVGDVAAAAGVIRQRVWQIRREHEQAAAGSPDQAV